MQNDITIIPPDDPKKLKLGWKIYENTGPCYLPSASTECYKFDKADKYKNTCGVAVKKSKSWSFAVVRVLEFLWGQPWNNLALNYVMGLNPTSIRVSTGTITADAYFGRVTVLLDKDERTIRKIEQEMQVGLIGCENGWDLNLKLMQQKTGKKIEPFDINSAFINPKAIAKIEIEK